MKKTLSALLALLLFCSALTGCTPKRKYSASFYLFDTYCSFTAYSMTKPDFDHAFSVLVDHLTVFHEETDIYHEYDAPNLAVLNRLAGKESVELSPELMDFLVFAADAYELSRGRLNVMLGPVTALWHQTRETGLLPSESELQAANALSLPQYLELTDTTARITEEGASIDVGALAKGYAGRLAQICLARIGVNNYVLDLGGTIAANGIPAGTGRSDFTIGIQDPSGAEGCIEYLHLPGGSCVATSGDYQRFTEINGKRYHHLIDPDTLYPSLYQHSVTIVCNDPALADLLSTALFMMTEEEGRALAASLDAAVYYH